MTRGRKGKWKGENGSALAVTLLMILTVTIFLFANIAIQQTYTRLSRNVSEGVVAENAARAGLAISMCELGRNPSWKTGFPWTPLTHVPQAACLVTFDAAQAASPWSTSNAGSGAEKKGFNDRSVPGGYVHIISLGRYGGQTRQVEAMIKVGGFNPFGKGVIRTDAGGINCTYLRNSDSWSSNLGSYNSTRSNQDGTIGSNTTINRGINLGTRTLIYGNIETGPGADPARVIQGRANQYDQAVPLGDLMDFPQVTVPDIKPAYANVTINAGTREVLPPGAYGALTVKNGGVAVLTDGSYQFGTITADYNQHQSPRTLPRIESAPSKEPVIVYTTGNVNLRNGDLVNKYKDENGTVIPSYLQIYGSPGTTMIEMRCGSSTAAGRYGSSLLLYAPSAALYLNGNSATSDFYGSLSVKQLSSPRTTPHYYYNAHYDKALQGFQCPEGIVPGSTRKPVIEASW